MARLTAWIGIALLSVYLVFFGGGWSGLYITDLRLASVLLVAFALAGWALVAWQDPAWRPRSVLLPAIGAALGSMVISTAASREPRQSIEYLGYAILLAALYLLLVRLLASDFFRARMGPLVIGFALILGVAFAAANLRHWIDFWGLVGHFVVPPLRPESESLIYGNPSTAMTMVLLFTCAAWGELGLERPGRRVVAIVLAVLAAFALFVSGSRSGWLAVAIAIVSVAVLAASDGERRERARAAAASLLGYARIRIAAGILALGAVGAGIALAPAILRRVTEGGEDLRIGFVVAAGRMFTEAPLLGTGPGTWVIQRIRYTMAPDPDYYIPHAHNVYAQTAAELGTVGLLAGAFLVLSVAWLVRDGLRDPDATRRRWAWVAAFVLVYFAAHQLLDVYMNMAASLFAAAIPVAWLDATASRDATTARRAAILGARSPNKLGSAARLSAVLLAGASVIGLGWSELQARTETRAVDLANEGRWAEADAAAQAARTADPGWAPYALTEGLTAAHVGDHARAAAAFEVVALHDDLPEAWIDLAAEELQLDHREAAVDALQRATRLGLQRPATTMAIGGLAEQLGDVRLSDEAFATAIALVPSLAGDPWFHADEARGARFEGIVDAAMGAAPESDRWQIALLAGRQSIPLPSASYAARSLTPDDVVAAWRGDDAAYARILDACDAHPLDAVALSWAARIAKRRDDVDTANHYLRWAYIGSSTAGEAGSELRVATTEPIGRTAAGGQAEFWGTYTYRRFTPWNLLVPTVVQLTLE